MLDPYKTLGVAKTATQDEIKNAYRALAKKFHPDLNPKNKEAEHKFKDINAAYEIVGDAKNRAKFDRGEWHEDQAPPGGAGQRRQGGPFYRDAHAGGGGARYAYDFGDIDEEMFESLFGARGPGRSRGGKGEEFSMPGQDEQYRLELSLREAIEGGERELQLPGGKRLSVKIPRGVVAGQKLRFSGQGGPGFGAGKPGDVYVELAIAPDERFARDGVNLVHEQSVPFDVALLGGEVTVPTPEGQVRLTVPARTSSGKRLRVPGKGLFARGGRRGDLLVKVLVALPAEADPDLEEAVRLWRERKERRAS